MKILLPVDGSRFSGAAVDFVASRTTLIGADPQVQLLNVQSPVPPRAARLIGKAAVTAYYEDESRKILKGPLATLKRAGIAADADYLVGHPAEQIARRADDSAVDLVAMGSHGHGALATLLFGSVTLGVLARTRRPLLLLRRHEPPPADSLAVGVAVDGSDYGVAAAKYVLKHLSLFGAQPRLTVLHVVPDFAPAAMPGLAGPTLPAYPAEQVVAVQQRAFDAAVQPVRRLFDAAGVPATAVCLTGLAGDQIAAWATQQRLDLLVLGSHGYGALKAAVLGSVAQRIAAHCDTPLLLIREA